MQIVPTMTDEEQKDKYWEGLKSEVYEKVRWADPSRFPTIDKLQDVCEEADNLLWQILHRGRRGKRLLTWPSNPPAVNSTGGGQQPGGAEPMDIGAIQAASTQGFGKLTPALKIQLQQEGKCFYCRTGNHKAIDCPLKKAKTPNGGRQ